MPTQPPTWSGAVWIGEVDLDEVSGSSEHASWPLLGGEHYRRARFLVRRHEALIGTVETPVVDGAVAVTDLVHAIADLTPPDPSAAVSESSAAGSAEPEQRELVTVIICSRDRADLLTQAMSSVLSSRDPNFELLVVDSASRDRSTAAAVASFADERVRFVTEPSPGLSRARNRGVAAARGTLLAFTDDDVLVDHRWIDQLRRGFDRAVDVRLVTGGVPTGELRTPTQAWFDRRVTWGGLRHRIYRLAERESPLFPLQVGTFGTGANFAVRRDTYLELGGMDEVLGAGSLTGGGEDIDFFLRVLLAGWAISVEPAALVWHRHRDDSAALRTQVIGYGRGLGAVLTKLACRPGGLRLLAPRIVPGLRHFAQQRRANQHHRANQQAPTDEETLTPLDSGNPVDSLNPVDHLKPDDSLNPDDSATGSLARTELTALLTSPWYYWRAWLATSSPAMGGPRRWRRRAG